MTEVILRKLNPPCRIEVMNSEALHRALNQVDMLSEKHNVSIEYPLFSARQRGIYRIVFLDKEFINNKNATIIQIE